MLACRFIAAYLDITEHANNNFGINVSPQVHQIKINEEGVVGLGDFLAPSALGIAHLTHGLFLIMKL